MSTNQTMARTRSRVQFSSPYSPYDYTISVRRKHRYWVVSSPEFGVNIASSILAPAPSLGDQNGSASVSPQAIGEAVVRLLSQIDGRLHELALRSEAPPKPRREREFLSPGDAARTLGISTATLRKMVRNGLLRAEKTPGGHLRVSIEELNEYGAVKRAEAPSTAIDRPSAA